MKRIQLKRTKGWRLPPNAMSVARPSKWSNPFTVKEYGRERALFLYREYITSMMNGRFRDLEELRGKDLACWCKPDEACHADVLIEMLAEKDGK
jgi:hypothetical protein